MQLSAELRWFWQRSAPDGLKRWFDSSGSPPRGEERRLDVYLLDPGQAELGIKKRGGKGAVEVKGLVRRSPQPLAAQGFSGHVEVWSKWTSEGLRLDGLRTIEVRKTRRLRQFDLGGATPEEVALDRGYLDDGCNLELAEVQVAGLEDVWWTLGFEAFGPLERVERNLERTLDHALQRDPPAFPPATEKSYPAWLRSLG